MPQRRIEVDNRCVLMAEEALEDALSEAVPGRFNRVVADIAKVYPTAILVGAVAAAQYISRENEPRITYDVDILLEEKEFSEFLADEIPEPTLSKLETHFQDPDSANHSLMHKETGIYVDLLSLESKPIRKKIVRYILAHREKTTNAFQVGGQTIDILKPEFLVAMKLNRYSKKPRSERGLCDRVDIMKVLKALWADGVDMDHDTIRVFCNQNEARCYAAIIKDAKSDFRT
ncbi:MAG: hypothetical protein R6U50_03305 [Desulfobacterales bacterium]